MARVRALAVGLFALLLTACSGSSQIGPTKPTSGNGAPSSPPAATFKATFRPASGILPFPTDLYFNGSTDGTLNIPASAFQPNGPGLNQLDGFGISQLITVNFANGSLSAGSLDGNSIHLIEVKVDPATKATVGVVQPLTYGTDYQASVGTAIDSGGQTLEIRPLHLLHEKSGYLIILTNGLRSAGGAAATPDDDYTTIKTALGGGAACPSITDATLNGVCRLTGANLQIAGALGIPPANVILSFSFSTQSISDEMAAVAAATVPTGALLQNTGLTTKQINAALQGKANVYAGVTSIPYYLSRTAPLTGFWQSSGSPLDPTSKFLTRYNPVPVATETLQIPVLLTIPNASSLSGGVKPASGWPVAIFMHGITRNRSDMFALADAYADAGFAVFAIDQPLHGITDPANPLYQAGHERTFDLDLANNSTGAPGADGLIDPSGTYFINLKSVQTSRDNLRQAASDLLTLAATIPTVHINGGTVPDFDASRIHFIGQSMGSITGIIFLANTHGVKSAVVNVPGGQITQLITESPSFGPQIQAGLVAAGLTPNTTVYNNFLRDTQTIIDAGDPQSFIARAAAAQPTLLQQVVGGGMLANGTASLPDQVIPNDATQRLIDIGGFTKITTPGVNVNPKGYVNFIFGSHGSILDPTASLAATVEMQGEAVKFNASGGVAVVISNPTVIQSP